MPDWINGKQVWCCLIGRYKEGASECRGNFAVCECESHDVHVQRVHRDLERKRKATYGVQPSPDWQSFPSYLLDKCERETITEESLQRWVAAFVRDPQYASGVDAAPNAVDEKE